MPQEKNFGSSLAAKILAGRTATYDDIIRMDEYANETTKSKHNYAGKALW